ncbi:MAG: hypothetical protein [Bacteriophage sp.]|nr:MAG: hypothetical protein [Bacteriophage sp.]
MAGVEDKLVDLKDMKALADDTTTKLGGKLAVPLNEGTVGQVLTANGDGTSEWKDTNEADIRRIVNEQLAKTKYTINDQGHLIIETPEA